MERITWYKALIEKTRAQVKSFTKQILSPLRFSDIQFIRRPKTRKGCSKQQMELESKASGVISNMTSKIISKNIITFQVFNSFQ